MAIAGPANLHVRGDDLVVVDTHGASSHRLNDVLSASVRTIDPAQTAGLIGLVAGAAAVLALILWKASMAPDEPDYGLDGRCVSGCGWP